MFRILLLSPYSGVVGGISRWTEHIKNYRDNIGDTTVNIKISDSGRSVLVNTDKYWNRLYSAYKDYRKILAEYVRNIKLFKPDVVHIVSSSSLGLFRDIVCIRLAKRNGAGTVVHFHFGRIPKLALQNNWEWKLLCKTIRISDKTIVIDSASYNTLKNKGFRDKTVYLPNPVAPEIEEIIQRQGDVRRKERKIVFAGHVIRTKGVFELVEACCSIPDITLSIIGKVDDATNDELLKLAARKGDAEWLDIQKEQPYEKVIYEMRSAAVFTLPSYTEGFPNVILESMICECPIVATSVGAIPEMLADNAGIVIEPQNAESLKEALTYVLDHKAEAERMGKKASERVKSKYSMNVVWKQLTDIWKNV